MTKNPTNIIELHDVKKSFGSVNAVAGVDLTVTEGELFGLIGHNGAGKTTLFKMMLGLLPATSGDIHIGGQAVRGEAFRQVRRSIGYLPESLALYDNLTGLETLHFFAKLKDADAKSCHELLERVGLSRAANQRVRGYSKGMRQRLGFAQALLGSPRLLFLDEPTNGLDPHGILEFYRTLTDLRRSGVTIILTSHILAEIQQRVDRLALMRSGRIQALGTVRELREARELPLSISITFTKDAEQSVRAMLTQLDLNEIKFRFEPDSGVAKISCPRERKMLLLQGIAGLGAAVSDVDVHEPTLEEVFLGYAEAQ